MIERNLDSQVEAFIIYDKEDDSPHTIDNVNAAKENQVTIRVSLRSTHRRSVGCGTGLGFNGFANLRFTGQIPCCALCWTEGGPGKQVTTTGVGPGNISR